MVVENRIAHFPAPGELPVAAEWLSADHRRAERGNRLIAVTANGSDL